MGKEIPEDDLMFVRLTEDLKESLIVDIPYWKVRRDLLADLNMPIDKKVFRFYLDRIAIKLLGKDTAYKEILIDEQRLKEEGEELTYPLYLGLFPGGLN